jgi:hypothetical protein
MRGRAADMLDTVPRQPLGEAAAQIGAAVAVDDATLGGTRFVLRFGPA